jgi:hypothetical protein
VKPFRATCRLAPKDHVAIADNPSTKQVVMTIFDHAEPDHQAAVALSREDALRLHGWLSHWIGEAFD